MVSNVGTAIDDVIAGALADEPGEVLLVNPSPAVLEQFVETVADRERRPETRLLGEEEALKAATEDFILASQAADLIEAGDLAIRTADLPRSSLLVTPDRVVSLVAVGDGMGGLATDDEEFVGAVADAYEAAWEEADEFSLRTPAISRVRETLADSIGPEVEADFEAMLASVETARGDDGLDEVVISLLVAAKNEVLLYDVSKWGENVGIASKATFSRAKTRLEDLGLVETEKVPIDVGRPRLRLMPGDDRLAEAPIEDLAAVARDLRSA
ncbi:MAG: transcriptional regulator TbsP [Halobacteriaceae archaeon]